MIRLTVLTNGDLRRYEAEDIEANETAKGGLSISTSDQTLLAYFTPGNWDWFEMRVIEEGE